MKKISACPSWLKLSEDRYSFVFVPDRAEIVRKIFELSIGGLGSYSIANHLNRQNVPPFGPRQNGIIRQLTVCCGTGQQLESISRRAMRAGARKVSRWAP